MSEVKNIVMAMSEAWAKLPTIAKDRTNPHFKSEYATLDAIVKTIRPILAAHGLWISQASEPCPDGASVQTRLYHKSGEMLDLGTVCVPVDKRNAQGYGSAMTYARRYGLLSALGLASGEDDDGNAAAVSPPESVADIKRRVAEQVRALGFTDAADIKAVVVKAQAKVGAKNDADGFRRVESALAEVDHDTVVEWLNGGAA